MPSFSLQEDYPAISTAANAFLRKLSGTHIETDIAGAASVAGLMLLRATGVDLSQLEPGGIVLVEWVNEAGIELSNFMVQLAENMGLDPRTGWTEPAPPDHQPRMNVLELTRALEAPFYAACHEKESQPVWRPYIAALTAMKMVSAGATMQLLDPDIGKSLAMTYLVAGSKTVPYPAPGSSFA